MNDCDKTNQECGSIGYPSKPKEDFAKLVKMCKECAGAGGGNADEDDGEGHIQRGVGDWENCYNCGGSGLEPDEEIIRERIVENLSAENEKKLQEYHAGVYHGTDDDMPDAFENWLGEISLTTLIEVLQ